MASAKGVRHIHDRDPSLPKRQCIKMSVRSGQRCKRRPTVGSELCRYHLAEARGVQPVNRAKAGVASKVAAEARAGARQPSNVNATSLVISNQARAALAKLGQPLPEGSKMDPKLVLLDALRASAQQVSVWESMLASVPPEDWEHVGKLPIPGSLSSSKGARIEVIQKYLAEATKNTARIAKLAIDAGIEERLVRLAEEQSALIADTVKAAVIAAIGSMRLSPAAETAAINAALGAAATHLRVLAAGAGAVSGQGEIIDGIAKEVEVSPL